MVVVVSRVLLLSPDCCCLLTAVVSWLLLSPVCWSNEARLLIGWFRWWLVHWLTVTGCRAQPARRWPLAILVARTAHKFEQHHPRPLLCSISPQGRVASTLRTIDLGWVPKPVYCPLVWSVYCPLVWSVYCPLVWSGLVGLLSAGLVWSGRSMVWSVYCPLVWSARLVGLLVWSVWMSWLDADALRHLRVWMAAWLRNGLVSSLPCLWTF